MGNQLSGSPRGERFGQLRSFSLREVRVDFPVDLCYTNGEGGLSVNLPSPGGILQNSLAILLDRSDGKRKKEKIFHDLKKVLFYHGTK